MGLLMDLCLRNICLLIGCQSLAVVFSHSFAIVFYIEFRPPSLNLDQGPDSRFQPTVSDNLISEKRYKPPQNEIKVNFDRLKLSFPSCGGGAVFVRISKLICDEISPETGYRPRGYKNMPVLYLYPTILSTMWTRLRSGLNQK